MTAPAPERPVVRVTDSTTKAEIAETLRLLNDGAKRLHRRGHVGIASEAYACQHRRLNSVLDYWEQAPE